MGGLVLTLTQIYDRLFPPPEPSPQPKPQVAHVNTEIVLDRSFEMAKRFGGGRTKLEAAVEAVAEAVEGRDGDNLALREFGGACEDASRMPVRFGRRNSAHIRRALQDVDPAGRADLVDAVIEATSDFSDFARFPRGVALNVVVVTSGKDTCGKRPDDAIPKRLKEIQAARRNLRLVFITVGAGKRERKRLSAVQSKYEGIEVDTQFAKTPKQAKELMEREVRVGPVFDGVEFALDETADSLRSFTDAVGEGDFERAQSALSAAERTFDATSTVFDGFETAEDGLAPDDADDLRRLDELAEEGRRVESQLLDLAPRLLELAQSDGGEEVDEAPVTEETDEEPGPAPPVDETTTDQTTMLETGTAETTTAEPTTQATTGETTTAETTAEPETLAGALDEWGRLLARLTEISESVDELAGAV